MKSAMHLHFVTSLIVVVLRLRRISRTNCEPSFNFDEDASMFPYHGIRKPVKKLARNPNSKVFPVWL